MSANVCQVFLTFSQVQILHSAEEHSFNLNIACLCQSIEINNKYIPVKLCWIFPGAPLIFNRAPGNIKGNIDKYEIRNQWDSYRDG